MGVFLSKPKTEKTCSSGQGNNMTYALSHMQGWRQEMEDADSSYVSLPEPYTNWSFFAVFDGHAGSVAAKQCSEKLLEALLSAEEFKHSAELYLNCLKNNPDSEDLQNSLDDLKESIISTYINFDDELRVLFLEPLGKPDPEKSGTTAVAVLMTPSHYLFINVGDSRSVLCGSNGEIRFASVDHKPNNVIEKLRIENAGGTVSLQRVNGQLAVSRAMGDFDYKNSHGLPTREQQVSPEPDISVVERLFSDQFLILACDGIYDVISNEELCILTTYLLHCGEYHEEICNSIINTCFHRGSRDNMSVIFISFPQCPTINSDVVIQNRLLDEKIDSLVTAVVEQEGPKVYLDRVFKRVTDSKFDFLPPGGGIHAKFALIEKLYGEKVPEMPEPNPESSSTRRSFQDIISGMLVNQNIEESEDKTN